MRIEVKPLSVNEVWKGRRFKTNLYKSYEKELLYKLKNISFKKENICLSIKFGYSSKGSDIDNCLKPFIDILQKKYNFNDSNIYELHVYKEIVKKGLEFIDFEITER